MPIYTVYQQRRPLPVRPSTPHPHVVRAFEWEPVLEKVGEVRAIDMELALDKARSLPAFDEAMGLAKFPIVEQRS